MNQTCPKGYILRKAYTRKAYTRTDGTRVKATRVPATCIKDVGAKGHGPKTLPQAKKGLLTSFGYSLEKKADSRRMALRKAIKKEGVLPILRHLNLRRNYIKLSQPGNYRKMSADVNYLKDFYRKMKA